MALAKLTPPKLHQVLPRERLFARLDACRERPLVWVSGPPGAGKTALVASWLQAHRIGGLWYQVDPGDRDLATFFHYLTLAAQGARKKPVALPRYTPDYHADPAGFARLYFRALFDTLKPPAAIVLDNYHELPADAPLHALLEPVARETPDRISLIATSRGDPPAECAALRANDRLGLLDWDELRLTYEETCGIAGLRQSSGKRAFDDDTMRRVHARADGWPVGLVLSLEQMRREGDAPTQSPDTQGREVLFAYFAGQILATLPEATRTQLMRIALLPRATPAQAAAIARDPHAATLLDTLYRKRLFVERRGEAYQFHDLFRAFLMEELVRTHDPDLVSTLRRDAMHLLADAGEPEAAFDCAARAQDWPGAASLVMRFAPMLLEQGRLPTLKTWCDAMPPPALEATPWLQLWRGVSLSPFAPVEARRHFEACYPRFGDDEAIGRVLSCAAILSTHYLEFDHVAVDQWLDALLPQLEAGVAFPAPAAELRVYGALLFALSFQRPRRDLVDACLAHLRALLPLPGVPVNARIDAATLLISHYQVSAEFDEAERVVAAGTPWLDDPEVTPAYRAFWMQQLAHLRGKQGRDAEALQLYDQARAIADANALQTPPLRVYSHIGRALVALCQGDADVADRERELAGSYWHFARTIDKALDAGLRSWIATHRGERTEALACARSHVEQMDAVGPVWLRYVARVQRALAAYEAGEGDDVEAALASARALLQGTCLQRLEHAADVASAWVLLDSRGPEAAREAIARCLGRREVHDGQWFLRVRPRVLPDVYAAAIALDIAPDEARRAIRAYNLRPPADDPPGWPWPFEVRMLGRFEVLHDGQPLAFSRKVPKKTLALLKAVVALGGRSVSEQRLIDALWPDEEGDAAARALDATVLRLRTLLGDPQAIVQRGGRVALDARRVWVDVFAFEQALANDDEDAGLARALALYRGAFLVEDEGEAWPVAARERLRGRFIHALARHAEGREAAGDDEAAIAAYLRGIDTDPAIESFYQGLMRCYARQDRRGEAIAAYQRLRQILSITLGLAPSSSSERLYQSLRANP